MPSAPAWVRAGAWLVRRLPVGRYRAAGWLGGCARGAFLAQMPRTFGGYWFRCDLRDAISKEVCFVGSYEPQETALIRAILRPGMNFVDVGANWGYFTLLGAHLVGETGRVISLEPDPRLFSVLWGNVQRNGLRQVTALQLAAASLRGELILTGYSEADGNFGLSRVVDEPIPQKPWFRVMADSLDEVLDAQAIDVIHVMKMDIEGSEGRAIQGLKRSLADGRIERLIIELHPRELAEHQWSPPLIMQSLREAGYRPFNIDHSPSVTRAVAYGRLRNLTHLLRPVDGEDFEEAWPHQLWTTRGLQAV